MQNLKTKDINCCAFNRKMQAAIFLERCILWFCMVLFFTGCSGTKFLKDNQSFYTGADIKIVPQGKINRKKNVRRKLEEYLTPKPNTVVLGSRPGVWFYFKAGTPKKKKGLKYFIKTKLGQPPVLMSDVKPEQVAKVLSGQLYNNGYFKSTTTFEVKTKNKKSHVIYTVKLFPAYRLGEITYPKVKDSVYAPIVRTLEEKSLLKTDQHYSLERMKAEQERIEKVVQNYGLYYFDNRYLIFEADSTVGKRKVDLDLKLEEGIPDKAKWIYRIDKVNVFADYQLTRDTTKFEKTDTIKVDRFYYIDDKHDFRANVITDVINLRPGNIYKYNDRELTLSHLMGLGAFKFVNIKFTESSRDSASLNASIYLTPLLKKSVRMEFQAISKSNNFVGPGFNITFTNRNFLRGAELFQFKLNTGYEWQTGRQNAGPLNSYEVGMETSLAIPRFITPVHIDYHSKRYLPQTIFKVGYNIQQRINYFRLNSVTASIGYTWRESTSKTHTLYPIDLNYVQLSKTSLSFDSLIRKNRVLGNAFENQFIPGLRYSFTLNTQLTEERPDKFSEQHFRKSNFYFNGNLDIAGNLLHLYQKNITNPESTPYTLFGSPYSQYVRNDIDFRYYWQIDSRNKLATRILIGVGYPYGNSTILPYIKQFASGGANSIRAFPARSIGPGTYNVRTDPNITTNTFFIDQRGDIKLEGNVEHRFDITKVVKGAFFVDAGNIWLWRKDPNRPGGEFNSNTFLQQLAVGTGFGLRFDFSFFILRFDLATPIRKPYLEPSKRWVIKDIDFGDKDWRSKNMLFNIAIGYPF
jgi:outer membrane protein insertion porin family